MCFSSATLYWTQKNNGSTLFDSIFSPVSYILGIWKKCDKQNVFLCIIAGIDDVPVPLMEHRCPLDVFCLSNQKIKPHSILHIWLCVCVCIHCIDTHNDSHQLLSTLARLHWFAGTPPPQPMPLPPLPALSFYRHLFFFFLSLFLFYFFLYCLGKNYYSYLINVPSIGHFHQKKNPNCLKKRNIIY